MDGRLTVKTIKDAVKNLKKQPEIPGLHVDINGVVYIDLRIWEEMSNG